MKENGTTPQIYITETEKKLFQLNSLEIILQAYSKWQNIYSRKSKYW